MHLSTFEVAKFAWRKAAPKDTARFKDELRDMIAFELEDMDEEAEVKSLWRRWEPGTYTSKCLVGVAAQAEKTRSSSPTSKKKREIITVEEAVQQLQPR